MSKYKQFINLISNSAFYWLIIITSIILGYYTYKINLIIPKPETFIELFKYYFTQPEDYLLATILNIISWFLWLTLGLTTFFKGFGRDYYYDLEYPQNLWLKWFILIISIVFILLSLYFLYYSGILILTLIVLGVITVFVIKNYD